MSKTQAKKREDASTFEVKSQEEMVKACDDEFARLISKDIKPIVRARMRRAYPILKQAFFYGASVPEACSVAAISTPTYYSYFNQKYNSRLSMLFAMLAKTPQVYARVSLVESFDKRPDLAFKYLERKLPDEFAPPKRIEVGKAGDFTEYSHQQIRRLTALEAPDKKIDNKSGKKNKQGVGRAKPRAKLENKNSKFEQKPKKIRSKKKS